MSMLPLALRRRASAVVAAIILLGSSGTSFAEDLNFPRPTSSNPRRTNTVEVVERVKTAVVNIHSERTVTDLRDNRSKKEIDTAQHRVNGMGTGIVIDPRGYLVTNHHVIDDVHLLRVRLADGTNLPARVIARDPEHDLAIVKVDPAKPLPMMPLGTSSDLMLAEPVIAIGNAYGYEHTVTTGIVSAMNRDVTLNREVSYKSLIQTSASINPGNSGGPLLNVHGELIGVNVAIRANAQNIAFALPIDDVLRQCAEMISVRKRTGLSHGMLIRDAVDFKENPVRRWAIVERVDAGSAAEAAGLKAGDVLEKLGEQPIRCALDVERFYLDRSVSDKVAVVAKRGTEAITADMTLKGAVRVVAATPVANGAGNDVIWKKMGARFAAVAPEAVNQINKELRGGLLVTELNPDGPAARSGFQKGDVLIGLHQWETISMDNITFVLNHADLSTFSPLRFFLVRNGQLRRGWLPNIE